MIKEKVRPCWMFGGVSKLTGKRVWSRHRWSRGAGKGVCQFFGYKMEEVREGGGAAAIYKSPGVVCNET